MKWVGLCVHWKLAATIHIYHWRLLLLLSWWSFYCPWRAEGWVDLASINNGIHCAHISNLSIKKWILNFKCEFSIYTVPLWHSSAMFLGEVFKCVQLMLSLFIPDKKFNTQWSIQSALMTKLHMHMYTVSMHKHAALSTTSYTLTSVLTILPKL